MTFLNAKDQEALRDHLLAMIERAQQGLRLLNRGDWKQEPATDRQKAFMTEKSVPFKEGISKGAASEKIDRYIQAKKKGA